MPRLIQPPTQEQHTMDIERINQLGSTLTDLGRRALDLRGYL